MPRALARPAGGPGFDKALEGQPSWRGVGFPLSPEKVLANQLQNGSCGATWICHSQNQVGIWRGFTLLLGMHAAITAPTVTSKVQCPALVPI